MNKKPYTKPELTAHGNVEKLTLEAGAPNADLPRGADGTAFPPG